MAKRVTVYVKPGCHLCDDVEQEVQQMRTRVDFEYETINIMSDPVLEVRYGFDIPVVEIDGVVFSTYTVDAAKLEAKLREA